jgi:uncharacterized protein YaaN involved in tellurite resistance
MPIPVKTLLSVASFLYKAGRTVYELIDEARHERKQREKELAAARREMSQRYQDASNTAGPEKRK